MNLKEKVLSRPYGQPMCVAFFCILMFIFERKSVSEEGAERGGDTESEADSKLRAVSTEPTVGLELMNCEIMT